MTFQRKDLILIGSMIFAATSITLLSVNLDILRVQSEPSVQRSPVTISSVSSTTVTPQNSTSSDVAERTDRDQSVDGYSIESCALKKDGQIVASNICPKYYGEARVERVSEDKRFVIIWFGLGEGAKLVRYDTVDQKMLPEEMMFDGLLSSRKGDYAITLGKDETLILQNVVTFQELPLSGKLPKGLRYEDGETTFGGPSLHVEWDKNPDLKNFAHVSVYSDAIPYKLIDPMPMSLRPAPVGYVDISFDGINWDAEKPVALP